MSFNEKSAWVMVCGLALSGAGYLFIVLQVFQQGGGLPPPAAGILVFPIVVLVAFSVIGHVVAAMSNLREANQPSDERHRKVVVHAGHWSGIVLGLGVLLSLAAYLFIAPSGALLFYLVLAMFWLANIVEYGLQIYFSRAVM